MAFVVFEGLDGSGKSTLIERFSRELQGRGQDPVLTREPGGTALAEDIRRLLLRTDGEVPAPRAELLLYAAARVQNVDRVIRPALDAGRWVLCDRFTASTVSFQCFARGLARSDVDWLNSYAVAGTSPDLVVLLDLPVEESFARRQRRVAGTGVADDRFEREATAFHRAVRQGYLAQAKEDPKRWLVLDARSAPDQLFFDLVAEMERRGWLER